MTKIGQIFIVQKDRKKVRWKVIEHPYFDGQLALVKDYKGLYGEMHSGYNRDGVVVITYSCAVNR